VSANDLDYIRSLDGLQQELAIKQSALGILIQRNSDKMTQYWLRQDMNDIIQKIKDEENIKSNPVMVGATLQQLVDCNAQYNITNVGSYDKVTKYPIQKVKLGPVKVVDIKTKEEVMVKPLPPVVGRRFRRSE
jgi:hypothetical protein